jgi:hypothetical protein
LLVNAFGSSEASSLGASSVLPAEPGPTLKQSSVM